MYFKINLILFSFFIFTLAGCSRSIPISNLNKEKMHELSITHTRKGEISDINSKIIIVVTYLNPIKADILDMNKENFLVGIYINSDSESQKSTNNPFYNFYLNKHIRAEDIVPLDKESLYLKFSPMINRWSRYYLIKFPHQNKQKLKLVFENKNKTKTILDFAKDF